MFIFETNYIEQSIYIKTADRLIFQSENMLYAYKMTHDTGFAPNPFHGILSLATCKPLIRAFKKIDDYIAGFTSKELCGDAVGAERLVYIMKITNKISFDHYYNDKKFKFKIPSNKNRISKVGDNIYFYSQGKYNQAFTYFHNEEDRIANDLKSDQVLLSKSFFYFGVGAVTIDKFKINIPKTQTAHGVKTVDEKEIERLWKYLEKNFRKNSVINSPHLWDEKEPYNLTHCVTGKSG